MPVTPEEFRQMALSFPETEERSHMNHPDFRVRGRIFATLSHPEETWGMVQLTPEQQEAFSHAERGVFEPAAGAWGRNGSTRVRLPAASKATVRRALAAAWENAAIKPPVKRRKTKPRARHKP
jgi:hypothetical protein